MPSARFVVVPAPLEEQLTLTIGERLREALGLALRLKRSVNDTLHDDALGQKANDVLADVTRPGGLPFVLFLMLVAVLALREILLYRETNRILKMHRELFASPVVPSKHQHDD